MSVFRCIICDESEWENVDEFRIKKTRVDKKTEKEVPINMSICKKCGFVGYPDLWQSPEDIKEFYKKDYRNPPTAQNAFSCQRKTHYHAAFLKPLIEEWNDKFKTDENGQLVLNQRGKPIIESKGRENIEICEVGAAYGVLLNYLKNAFPGSKVEGTEWTSSYRRNAFWEFGINLEEEFNDKKEYDLICSYKVLEHQQDADKELRKYVKCLKPGGYMYVGVPTWFDSASNFGLNGFDLEYYYSLNHINVWTRKHFETLLKKCGLEVVQENHVYYDDVYLCKRNDDLMGEVPEYEDPADIKDKMKKLIGCFKAFTENKFEEALKLWPNFPSGYMNYYEFNRKEFHKKGYSEIKKFLDNAISKCPNSNEIHAFAGEVSMRYNEFDKALQYLEEALKRKPESPGALMSWGQCYRQMAHKSEDPEFKIKCMREARAVMAHLEKVSLQTWSDACSWKYSDNAELPTPFEQGVKNG